MTSTKTTNDIKRQTFTSNLDLFTECNTNTIDRAEFLSFN